MQGDVLADRTPMQLIHYSQLLCHLDLQRQGLKPTCVFDRALNSTDKSHSQPECDDAGIYQL